MVSFALASLFSSSAAPVKGSKRDGRVGLKWRSFIILFFSGFCAVAVPGLYNCGEGGCHSRQAELSTNLAEKDFVCC